MSCNQCEIFYGRGGQPVTNLCPDCTVNDLKEEVKRLYVALEVQVADENKVRDRLEKMRDRLERAVIEREALRARLNSIKEWAEWLEGEDLYDCTASDIVYQLLQRLKKEGE